MWALISLCGGYRPRTRQRKAQISGIPHHLTPNSPVNTPKGHTDPNDVLPLLLYGSRRPC